MIETFLVGHPFLALAVWVLLFISDYYLTLWGAIEYRRSARAHVELGGSYELEPVFQKDIDALRRVSPEGLFQLLLASAALLFLWWLSVRNVGYPALFLVGFGALTLTEVVIHIRHVRNIVSFRAFGVPDAVTGHIKYSRWVTRRISNVDLLSFAALFALCYALSGRALFIGGVLGCLGVVRRHIAAARQERNGIRRALRADAVSVARIHVESWKVAYRGIMPQDVIARTDVAYRTKSWKEQIASRDWPVLLLEKRGVPLAFCQMVPSRDEDDDPTRVGHITSLHVLPQLRGRGHGHALMDHVLAEFGRRGFTDVTLWVLEANQPARRFYEKSGFALDGGRRTNSRTEVPEVRYRIRIPHSI
jgi:ribosomal protein S18 acetylase RimI-like enzyme